MSLVRTCIVAARGMPSRDQSLVAASVAPTLVKSMHGSIMLKATCTHCRSNYALIDTLGT